MKEELLKGLSEEQIAEIKACKSQKELLEFAKKEGIELNDEQLEAVSGGCGTTAEKPCPKCGKPSKWVAYVRDGNKFHCANCNLYFEV